MLPSLRPAIRRADARMSDGQFYRTVLVGLLFPLALIAEPVRTEVSSGDEAWAAPAAMFVDYESQSARPITDTLYAIHRGE